MQQNDIQVMGSCELRKEKKKKEPVKGGIIWIIIHNHTVLYSCDSHARELDARQKFANVQAM